MEYALVELAVAAHKEVNPVNRGHLVTDFQAETLLPQQVATVHHIMAEAAEVAQEVLAKMEELDQVAAMVAPVD